MDREREQAAVLALAAQTKGAWYKTAALIEEAGSALRIVEGHTGVIDAAVQGIETVDACMGAIRPAVAAAGGLLCVTADHGNSEMMIDPTTGGIHTAHTTNPVPFVAVASQAARLRTGGSLRDVAPTVLHLLGIEPPTEMTGRDLREC